VSTTAATALYELSCPQQPPLHCRNYRVHKSRHCTLRIIVSTRAATALYELSCPQESPLHFTNYRAHKSRHYTVRIIVPTRASTALYELSCPQEPPLHSTNYRVHKSRHCIEWYPKYPSCPAGWHSLLEQNTPLSVCLYWQPVIVSQNTTDQTEIVGLIDS
jgi:hypothetical protein